MKIRIEDTKHLKDISVGGVFEYGGSYFIKTDEVYFSIVDEELVKCVDLSDGVTEGIAPNEEVFPWIAEVVLK